MATIQTVFDRVRGCGTRKPGGLYLMSGNYFRECGKLPIPLTVCPCCGQGIKPSRGWTWVTGALIKDAPCRSSEKHCSVCPLHTVESDYLYGLIWVGEKFYKRPSDFIREANGQGISRRISFVPTDFILGVTQVMLAHRKAIYEPENPLADDEGFLPGAFTMFTPDRIEYVVKGDESEEQLDRMEKRGITLVRVEMAEKQTELDLNIIDGEDMDEYSAEG
jgi:hypothetical protein